MIFRATPEYSDIDIAVIANVEDFGIRIAVARRI